MMPRHARLQDDDQSGSSIPGEPEFLVVGKLGKPHGVDGEIVMEVYTDFPERVNPQFFEDDIIPASCENASG